MSKNLQKILAGSLATLSSLSVVTPVMGATVDVDTLYKNAYEAMRTAEKTEKQSDINIAMDLIRQLRAVGEEQNNPQWMSDADTWSSLVDKVQHPKLVKIVDAIVKAQDTGRQADINAAFATIEPELPASWKNSYTSAIDIVQQKLQRELVYAVEEAEKESTVATEAAARALVNEVLTSKSEAMVNWAKIFEAKLDALILIDQPVSPGFGPEGNVTPGLDAEVGTLNITEIGEITQKQLTINFEALTSNLDDVTLTIIDNSGNTVHVKGQTLVKGQTTATFTFNDYLQEKPMGVWSVNGIKVDLTVRAFLKDINAVSSENNLKNKLSKEEYTGLVTYDEKNLAEYWEAIKEKLQVKKESFSTVKELQDLINKVDEEIKNDMTEAKYIESLVTVAKKGTKEQFANVLEQGVNLKYIKDVNNDWVSDYKTAIKNNAATSDSKENIQNIINDVRNQKVTVAVNALNNALNNGNKTEVLAALQNSLLGLDAVKAKNIDAYYIDKATILSELGMGKADDLLETNKFIKMLNGKSNVVNATSKSEMLNELKDFADIRDISEFNVLSTENKQDAAEELLKVSYDGELKLTDKSLLEVDKEVKSAVGKVRTNLEDLKLALEAYKNESTIVRAGGNDASNKLRAILNEITGQDVSADKATKFYEASLNDKGELKTYTNYTDVRATLK